MIEDVVSAASSILFMVGWGFAWQASPSGGARSMGRWSTLFCRMERALPDAAVFGAFYGDEGGYGGKREEGSRVLSGPLR